MGNPADLTKHKRNKPKTQTTFVIVVNFSQMPIIYGLVARGATVLAEFTPAAGNFTIVTRRILEKIPAGQNTKMSYTYDAHLFHFIVSNGLTYLCMADEAFPRRIAFSFLEDLEQRFQGTYGARAQTALAYGMNDEFSRVIRSRMDHFSSPEADKLSQVRGEIGEVKNIMVTNIEKVLERGEKIDLLVTKTETLNQQAITFKKQGTRLKQAMWWKNMKLNLIIFVVVLLLILFIIMGICGVKFQCDKKN
eukprot:c4677_g1_i1.p1 GENE.c4677_g1_i1~~c4677_g1_i1.p1  ORF type:complete len:249 (+),score=44.19 c4677_g1_i1:1-747(+)